MTRVDNDFQPLDFCSGEGHVSLQFKHKQTKVPFYTYYLFYQRFCVCSFHV